MKEITHISAHLTQILSFFPRVDTKAAGLFVVNTAMVSIALLNLQAGDLGRWYVGGPAAVLAIGLLVSYYQLYRCNFPDLQGGQQSLIYFGEIKQRTEAVFIRDYEAISEEKYRHDLLGQVWRNSQILSDKYGHMCIALRCTFWSVLPFIALLIGESVIHSVIPTVKG